MKKFFKTVAIVLAIILIAFAVLLANAFFGNPISKALAQNTAQKYFQQTYSNTDYELGNVTYSFKDGFYYAPISSPSSIDTCFSLAIDSFGRLQHDYFADYVTTGRNTISRLEADYRRAVEAVFQSESFPYEAHIAFGELVYAFEADKAEHDIADYAIIVDELPLDVQYDVNALGTQAGKLTVYIWDDTVSAAHLAEILLDIRASFDGAGIGFRTINCVLEYPREENTLYEGDRFEVMDFAYSDIYEEGLVERVEESNAAANRYYQEQDGLKHQEKI
ncbi:MAG: hypothetical protein IKV02_06615 [Clostridia bacterium]|nr:hypothetical protein [Clostridia bacterium]